MKLQSLNCPNCGFPLRNEGNMQFCDSCGSSFKIDYDESDVEYERLKKPTSSTVSNMNMKRI